MQEKKRRERGGREALCCVQNLVILRLKNRVLKSVIYDRYLADTERTGI